MTARISARLAAGAWVFSLLATASMLTLVFGNRTLEVDEGLSVIVAVASLAFATIGALIAARKQHPIGWLLCLVAIAFPLNSVGEQYALRGLVAEPGSLPATTLAAWVASWVFVFAATPVSLIFLLFPTGRLPGARWRSLVWIISAAAALAAISWALRPGRLNGPFNDFGVHVVNPLGLQSLETPLRALFVGAVGVSLMAALAAIFSLVVRFRRSIGEERQQVKWLALVAVTAASLFLIGIPMGAVAGDQSAVSDLLFAVFFLTLTLGVPASVAIAIFRYRLYDIDRIINRTLVYGSLTVLLGGLYVGVVVGLGALVGDSGLLVAASTLLVAALFRPARRRIQGAIDRRFYRRKYDAVRTLEAFSARLRDEVDLDALSAELVTVVRDTMQPAHASLWLRANGPASTMHGISSAGTFRNDSGTRRG